jgi:hypothetical protein
MLIPLSCINVLNLGHTITNKQERVDLMFIGALIVGYGIGMAVNIILG